MKKSKQIVRVRMDQLSIGWRARKKDKKRKVLLTKLQLDYVKQCVRVCTAISCFVSETQTNSLREWAKKFTAKK